MPLSCACSPFAWHSTTAKRNFKIFQFFHQKKDGLSPNHFQGVCKSEIPIVEDLLTLNILLYDINFVYENVVGELARRSVLEYENTVRLLRYKNNICYVNNINAVFHSFRCPNFDNFFNKIFNLERNLTICSERVKNVYPKNVYHTQETLFDKLDSFGIEYTNEQILFKNLTIFDFESIFVQEESFKDTDTTKWFEKRISIPLSISSNLVKEHIFHCNSDPRYFFYRCS